MEKDLKLCKKIPTLVAFTAKEWCPPCQRFEPEIEKLKKHEGINFHFIQCDQSFPLLTKYINSFEIGGYPSVLVYLPHIDKFVEYKDLKESVKLEIFIKKISNMSFEELNKNQYEIWSKVPMDDIQFIDHGDSCAKLS